jgi:hypothetical protein
VRTQVETDDSPGWLDARGDAAGNDASSAADIEDALAGLGPGGSDQR